MTYQEWASEMHTTVQGIAFNVSLFSTLTNDAHMQTYEQGVPANMAAQISALKSAVLALDAALTPEVKQFLGIV